MATQSVSNSRPEDASPFRSRGALEPVRQLLRRIRLARIALSQRGFAYGRDVAFARGADMRAPHHVRIGDRVSFGKNFTCEADLTVGDDVLISSNVGIVGNDHRFDDPAVTVYAGERNEHSPVVIGDDVWIGFGATIVGPVKIGNGCVIGAGSVVVCDLPDGWVCVGVPAHPVKPRYHGADEPLVKVVVAPSRVNVR